MVKDPLDIVFMSPEECLAMYLRAMPKNLIPVFEREFIRRPAPLGGAMKKKVLEVVCEAFPSSVDRDYLTERTGYQRSSRDVYLQRMSAKRLIEVAGKSQVVASKELSS